MKLDEQGWQVVELFRIFGNGEASVVSCRETTARAMASPSEFDGDYYTSRGGLAFAAVLCVIDGIPAFYELAEFKATAEQARAATEAAQEIF